SHSEQEICISNVRQMMIIKSFAFDIIRRTVSGVVRWSTLNKLVDARERSSVASQKVRTAKNKLNEHIKNFFGNPPSGEEWFLGKKGEGVGLNPSVDWIPSKDLAKMISGARTYDHAADPKLMEEMLLTFRVADVQKTGNYFLTQSAQHSHVHVAPPGSSG